MPVNILILILVFLLGVLVGGLIVSIWRASVVNRIRDQFREELEKEVIRRAGQDVRDSSMPPKPAAPAENVDSSKKRRTDNHEIA